MASASSNLGTDAIGTNSDGTRGLQVGQITILDLGALLKLLGIDLSALPVATLSNLLGALGLTLPGLAPGVDLSGAVTQLQSAISQVRQHTVYDVQVANGLNHMAMDQLKGHPDVLKVEVNDEDDTLRVTLNDDVQDGSFIAELLVKTGFRVKLLREEEIDLEDVFMGITKGITN